MRARSTCLRGRLRSTAIAANCSRSAVLNTTHTCGATPWPSIAYPDPFVYLLNDSEHWLGRRIASSGMLPEGDLLPHLICSRPIFIGGANDEADQHDDV